MRGRDNLVQFFRNTLCFVPARKDYSERGVERRKRGEEERGRGGEGEREKYRWREREREGGRERGREVERGREGGREGERTLCNFFSTRFSLPLSPSLLSSLPPSPPPLSQSNTS